MAASCNAGSRRILVEFHRRSKEHHNSILYKERKNRKYNKCYLIVVQFLSSPTFNEQYGGFVNDFQRVAPSRQHQGSVPPRPLNSSSPSRIHSSGRAGSWREDRGEDEGAFLFFFVHRVGMCVMQNCHSNATDVFAYFQKRILSYYHPECCICFYWKLPLPLGRDPLIVGHETKLDLVVL